MRAGRTPRHIARPPVVEGNLARKAEPRADAAVAKGPAVDRRPQAAPPKAAVSARLFQAWKSDFAAPVADGELKEAVDALFFHHHDKGFFGVRHEGQVLEQGLGPDDDLEIFLAPNRKADKEKDELCGCPFCVDSAPVRRVAEWRSWQVLPNAYPYAPAHSQHTLLAWQGHREQTTDADIVRDVLSFQQLTRSDERPVTMHFNGTAGNSETHLHWHATRERIPLEGWLDDGEAELETLRRTPEGAVQTWEKDSFSGVLVEGDDAFVARWGARLTKVVAADDDTVGRYNLLALPRKDGRARFVILARRAGEDLPAMGGAWAAAGRAVRYETELPDTAEQDFLDAAEVNVVHPDEIEALRGAATQGLESSVLALRLAR